MPKPPPTNMQTVRDIMSYSEYGPLIQAFVMEGLRSYSEMILKTDLPENGFIAPDLWKGCAQEVLDKLNRHYVESRSEA
jgi:hypothetical protein